MPSSLNLDPIPTIVDLRINETLQTGGVRKPPLPFSRLVGTVFNSAYAVRLETAPTRGESVYLFLEFTIVSGGRYGYPSRFEPSMKSGASILGTVGTKKV